ncbi:alpha-amylase family glycosyl hydrolase [Longimicrobium sp.]|uniref:alpha-amylase family glycosyl hydrolase n=1 Tax=Longimicrobium sp. TaxID=2029185 RepID=UPI002E368B50|nr:alpha-amylase family glycosyl hydrolase [Longimicrobium sp.]HEX6041361.1 alpha-amylase family glycosyl hydrolase [Longimicrobium sp.]
MTNWAADAVFYHIYPLGLCGAPHRNDFQSPPEPRLAQLHDWIPHLRRLGINAVYLGPLFESTEHGYDTADYGLVDRRLGETSTLAGVVEAMHAAGIRVILDGVFHHVGRDFWAFRDLQAKGESSAYRDWFTGVDFGRRSPHGDPFAYEGWRGHYDLVKLNLHNPVVRAHLFGAVEAWTRTFGIDGLRLDVAEDIDPGFLRALAAFSRTLKPDFWLLGEAIHGDYRRLAGPEMLDSATNYEAYKGLYSSHNDRNYHEIAYTLNRQFGEGGIYRDLPMYAFVDNHDVNRIASTLREPTHLVPLHVLLFTMPGVPSVYYGSEWGIAGTKGQGSDWPLRPALRLPQAEQDAPHPALAELIARLTRIRHEVPALRRGRYRQLHVASEQLAFARELDGERVIVAVNAASSPDALEVSVPSSDGTAFLDLLDDGWRGTVAGGRLRIDAVPATGGRILARVAGEPLRY